MGLYDRQTDQGGVRENAVLLAAVTVAGNGPTQTMYGGDYVFTVTGTFNGASVQLQALGPDGATYLNVGPAKTAPDTASGTGYALGSNAVVRANVTGGPPGGITATLSRLP